MKRLRIALVGTGKIAVESHLSAALSNSGVELTAVVDISSQTAQDVIVQYGLNAKSATDVTEVLEDIDAAIISTPNNTHAAIACSCLSHGKHVLIEKPMTTTVTDARMICQVAKDNGCIAATGYFLRFNPNVQRVKQLIDSKQFGQVKQFVYRHGTRGGWSPISSYTLNRDAVGGGSLVVLGTHLLDLIVHWFGYPDNVTLHDDGKSGGPEAHASARLKYNDGFSGEVLVSKTVNLPEGCAIEFEQGILLFQSRGESQLVFRPFGIADLEYKLIDRQPVPNQSNLFELQLQDFVSACLRGEDPSIPAEIGLMNVRLLEQLYENRVPIEEDWYATDQPSIESMKAAKPMDSVGSVNSFSSVVSVA